MAYVTGRRLSDILRLPWRRKSSIEVSEGSSAASSPSTRNPESRGACSEPPTVLLEESPDLDRSSSDRVKNSRLLSASCSGSGSGSDKDGNSSGDSTSVQSFDIGNSASSALVVEEVVVECLRGRRLRSGSLLDLVIPTAEGISLSPAASSFSLGSAYSGQCPSFMSSDMDEEEHSSKRRRQEEQDEDEDEEDNIMRLDKDKLLQEFADAEVLLQAQRDQQLLKASSGSLAQLEQKRQHELLQRPLTPLTEETSETESVLDCRSHGSVQDLGSQLNLWQWGKGKDSKSNRAAAAAAARVEEDESEKGDQGSLQKSKPEGPIDDQAQPARAGFADDHEEDDSDDDACPPPPKPALYLYGFSSIAPAPSSQSRGPSQVFRSSVSASASPVTSRRSSATWEVEPPGRPVAHSAPSSPFELPSPSCVGLFESVTSPSSPASTARRTRPRGFSAPTSRCESPVQIPANRNILWIASRRNQLLALQRRNSTQI